MKRKRPREGQGPLPFESCRDHCDEWTATRFGIDGTQLCCGGSCFNEGRRDYDRRLIEVGTFELADFTQTVPIGDLPPIIASAQFDRREEPDLSICGQFVAVKYWRVGGLKSINPGMVAAFRRKHRIPIFQGLLVHGEAKDSKQESLWQTCRMRRFFQSLKALPGAIYISPNFSVYTDGTQCQFHQRYNLARSVKFASMLNAVGLPTVTSISCGGSSDRRRIAEWLKRQQDRVTHLAINAQMKGSSLTENLADVAEIERLSGCHPHWVIFGPCRQAQFAEVFKTIPKERVTFVTSAPFHCMRAGVDLHKRECSGMTLDDRLGLILDQLQDEYERATTEPATKGRKR